MRALFFFFFAALCVISSPSLAVVASLPLVLGVVFSKTPKHDTSKQDLARVSAGTDDDVGSESASVAAASRLERAQQRREEEKQRRVAHKACHFANSQATGRVA